MSPNPVWLGSLQKGKLGRTQTKREDQEGKERRRPSYKPTREASEEINSTDTLVLDFYLPEVQGEYISVV